MRGRRSLVGLIGANIMSSLSPALQEDAFAAAGIRGTYHLMDLDRLPGRRLEHLMAAVKAAGFDGINVTFPCKTAVLRLLEEVSVADLIRHYGSARCRLVDSLPDAIATAAGVVNATPVGMQGIPGNPVPVCRARRAPLGRRCHLYADRDATDQGRARPALVC
jgi:shikimate 5-dehydrogenase